MATRLQPCRGAIQAWSSLSKIRSRTAAALFPGPLALLLFFSIVLGTTENQGAFSVKLAFHVPYGVYTFSHDVNLTHKATVWDETTQTGYKRMRLQTKLGIPCSEPRRI